MASLFDYIFNRKMKSAPVSPEEKPGGDELWKREPEPVLRADQMEALSQRGVRSGLRRSAEESLRGCNLSQTETDFGKVVLPEGGANSSLLFMNNPEVRDTLKAMYERNISETEPRRFEDLFSSDSKEDRRRIASALSGMLLEFDRQKVPAIEFTDENSIRQGVPTLLRRGFEAMVLTKSVQGELRDQVNTWISLETGEEKSEAQARWRRLDVLTGARNAALDICRYFSTDEFETGDLPQTGDEKMRRLLVNCACSLHYVNDSSYKGVEEKPLIQVSREQASYIRRGGDYRAFYDAASEELSAFLKGESAGVTVRHRPDYLVSWEAVRKERMERGERAPVKVTLSDLQKQEMGKDSERSRGYEMDQKGRTLRSGRAGLGYGAGKHDGDAAGKSRQRDGGRWL